MSITTLSRVIKLSFFDFEIYFFLFSNQFVPVTRLGSFNIARVNYISMEVGSETQIITWDFLPYFSVFLFLKFDILTITVTVHFGNQRIINNLKLPYIHFISHNKKILVVELTTIVR